MSIVKIIVLAVIVGAFVLFAGRIGLRRLSRPAAGAPHLRRPVRELALIQRRIIQPRSAWPYPLARRGGPCGASNCG
jgi:hypothetical protein